LAPELRLILTLEAPVALSEDPAKVLAAMKWLVGEALYSLEEGKGRLRIMSEDPRSISRIHDQLRDRRVRSAARRLLTAGRSGDRAKVMVNRQAATSGVFALCSSEDQSPLGPIYLSIESAQLDAIIEWLTAYGAG